MRRFGLLSLLALLCGTAQAVPLRVGTKVEVPLHDLKPSQMEVGRAEVKANLVRWKQHAAEHGETLADYARTKLAKRFRHVDIEAVIDPKGNVRPTDGHHRISALVAVEKETGVAVPVKVHIAADYRGQSTEAYAHDFLETRGKGYFTRDVEHLAPAQRIAHLPDTFAGLKNSPMRSAMARLFTRMKIDDVKMVDYAEFKVADYLIDHHLFKNLEAIGLVRRGTSHLPQTLASDPVALAVMEKALETPDARKFLLTLSKEGPRRLEKRLDGISE